MNVPSEKEQEVTANEYVELRGRQESVLRFLSDDVEGGLLVQQQQQQLQAQAQCGSSARAARSTTLAACRRAALYVAMVLLVVVLASLSAFFLGWASLVQMVVVAGAVFLCTGRRYRWFYVAARTAPRDIRAFSRFLRVQWMMHGHSKRNVTVSELFQEMAAKYPDKVCLKSEEEEMTFAQVEEYSNKVASVFMEHGYRKGDVVALFMDNRPEFVCLWLGLAKIGVVVPLINYNLRLNSLLHSVTVADSQAIIYCSDFADAVKDISKQLPSKVALYSWSSTPNNFSHGLGEKNLTALLQNAPTTAPVVPEKPAFNDRLVYIYTSGTTGLPKAAVITNAKYIFISSAIRRLADFRDSDKFYCPLPLYHTAGGCMSVGQSLLFGSTLVIRKKFSASAYFSDCQKFECTVAQYIGEMCRYILSTPPKPEDTQHKIRLMFGNGLRPQIWKEFVDRFNIPAVAEFYGATEGNANIVNIDNTVGAIGFVSRILPAVYPISIIKVDPFSGEPIRDKNGLCMRCAPDEPGVFVGKITSHPSRAFLGYVNKKDSEKKVVHDVFTKGDMAFLSGDLLVADEFGYLYFRDRTGDTFRWKGENVSTSEVEAVVSNAAGYRDAVVYGVEVPGNEGRAGMAAILDQEDNLDLTAIAEGVRKALPAYARPQFIRALRQVEMTGTFKLKKKDLQTEGFNPSLLKDKVYYFTSKGEYQLLTEAAYQDIIAGKIRF
ncbi:Long-chain fatty acid transport protein 4 [Frankliniella fusca]|uniref:long-chain-fatty-acid--CoA ligase n=1 Tax=Frankliniella fusca TaxID=407009 RepID=A0AAE1HGL4_9NEOP|nr:Long-chain fatty acid transport protein 4 [Frankliniella fusca]